VRRILKKSALISLLIFSSRILGVVRDALIAMCFGTTSQSDAFFIALRPFDLLRKLFSDGVLSIAFVPVFSEILEREGHSNAVKMVFSFFCFLCLCGIVIVIGSIFFAPQVVRLIAPGFISSSYQTGLTILLFKIMLPYFWLVSITALCMGVLNSLGHFGAPAVAPAVFNLVIIAFTLFVSSVFEPPIICLAVGVIIGGILQLAIQIPFMIRSGMLKFSLFQFFHPGIKKVVKIMLPCMIGAASYQINIMVASFFASKLGEGSVSFLYYADRLVQFPLALFTVSAATVLLPDLSRMATQGKLDDMVTVFSNGFKLVLFITIPSMAGLMALNDEIVTVLFGHGVFDASAILKTAGCLFYLVMGLWAYTGIRLFVTFHYAVSSVRIPFFSGIIAIGLNFILCFLFVDRFGLTGLVLGVSLSAMAGFAFLFIFIPGGVRIDKWEIFVSACRAVFLSVIMFFLVKQMAAFTLVEGKTQFWFDAGVIGCIGFGVIFYVCAGILISSPELKMVKRGLIKE